MLDINEYNKLLYRQLDRKAEEKSMISDYGRYLQHSKSKEAESGIELQAASWLANYNGIIRGERFTQTPQGMKQICEGLIPQASKLLRKANKKGAPEETKAELRNARKFLEDCLADANAALQHSDDSEHIEHGQKWRKHRYVRIENGRYIYPEDLQKANKPSSTNTVAASSKVKEDVKDFVNSKTEARDIAKKGEARDNAYWQIETSRELKDYANEIAKAYANGLISAKNNNIADFETTDKNWSDNRSYDSLLKAANKMEEYCKTVAEQSDGAVDWYEIRKSLESRILAPKIKEAQKKYAETMKTYNKNADYAANAGLDRAEKERINAATDPNDPWLKKRTEHQKTPGSDANWTKAMTKRAMLMSKSIKHSDSSDSITATAMSRDEYEELLKKAESLT